MKNIERICLSDVLGLCKKPHYVLGTTYSLSLAFFESVVFPCIQEKELRRCLLISDAIGYQRALSEAPALRGAGQEYLIVSTPSQQTFHSKVWLVMDDKDVSLLVGSGNLTQSGFIGNAELFDVVQFSRENAPPADLHADLLSFLSGLIGLWQGRRPTSTDLCVETLSDMRKHLETFKVDANARDTVRFVHSFRGPLIDQMPHAPAASRLHVAAPYFGGTTAGLSLLTNRYPKASLFVYPAIHPGDELDVSPKAILKVQPKTTITILDLAPRKQNVFAHLKLYGVENADGTAWVNCTSANCTHAAWTGNNIEAGLLRPINSDGLRDYFIANKKTRLPDIVRQQPTPDVNADRLIQMTGVDTGVSLDLTIDPSASLPLRTVFITGHSGSRTGTVTLPLAFDHGNTVSINWSAFLPWALQRGTTISIEIAAIDDAGRKVRTGCFAENHELLVADPIHRKANRGMLALINQEGAPELADIAAIFSLIGNAFHGRLVSPLDDAAKRVLDADSTTNEEALDSPKLPLWPPQEPSRELHGKATLSQLGHLHWCQKILGALVNPRVEDTDHVLTVLNEDQDDDSNNLSEAQVAQRERLREENEHRQRKTAGDIWRKTWTEYGRLSDLIVKLVPNTVTAPNVWPVSLFIYLTTMAVYRSTRRMFPLIDITATGSQITDHFLTHMLEERRQSTDFCCPRYLRYRSEVFPSLADDLHQEFNVRLDTTLARVMLTLVADQRMRMSPNNEYPGRWQPIMRKLDVPATQPDVNTEQVCLLLWRRYLHSESDTGTESEFLNALRTLCSNGGTAA